MADNTVEEGKRAFKSRASKADCPYPAGSDKAKDWVKGWLEAKQFPGRGFQNADIPASPFKEKEWVEITKGAYAGKKGYISQVSRMTSRASVEITDKGNSYTTSEPWDNLKKINKPKIENSSFSNGVNKAQQEIANKLGKVENGAKIKGGGKGFQVVDVSKVLGDFSTYEEATKFLTVGLKAQKESQDWHDDQITFGATDARRRMGR